MDSFFHNTNMFKYEVTSIRPNFYWRYISVHDSLFYFEKAFNYKSHEPFLQ